MTFVNCIAVECTHYCGRPEHLHRAKGNPIDLSILGNRCFHEDRDQSISDYGDDLLNKINEHEEWRELIRAIPDDAILGCFCYPKDCHCQMIIAAKRYIKEEF